MINKLKLFAIISVGSLLSSASAFAFLGMNAGATLQGPLPAWTKQLGSKGSPKQTYTGTVAVDSSGNAYVTGYTNGGFDGSTLTGASDYILTKYDSSGAKAWTIQRGVASHDVEANAVTTDSSGNAIITGDTDAGVDGNSQTGTFDLVVVKFDSTGARLWTHQLGVASKSTHGRAVAVDSSGNILVSGNTSGGLDGNALAGATDAFVTKYDSSGTKLWTKQIGAGGQFTYGTGVAVDSSGNVFLEGYTSGGLDGNPAPQNNELFVTKYDSAGNKQWTKQLGTGSTIPTQGTGVTTDSSGNIFVTGYTQGGLDGNPQTGTYDAFVAKYDTSGNRVWTRQLGVASQFTFGYGVSTDSSGNIAVAGMTTGGLDGNSLTGTQDLFVTKYDPSGTKQWTKLLGVASRPTEATGVAVDSSGNIRVTGTTEGDLDGNTLIGKQDLFLTKYSPAGSKLWTRQKGAVTGSAGTVSNPATATDASGNVFVTGYTNVGLDGNAQTGTTDFFITKYNSSGARLWTNQLGVSAHNTQAYGVATDSSGNVYVAGYTSGGLDGNSLTGVVDYFITKYNSSGVKQWTKQAGAASGLAQVFAIATDSSGSVYVAGETNKGLDGNTLTGYNDYFVVKFNSSGTRQWTRQMGGYHSNAYAYGVATDSSGNVFVVGQSGGTLDGISANGPSDGFVVKYDTSGTKLWTKLLDQSVTNVNSNGVATDSSGNVIIAGWTDGGYAGNTPMGNHDVLISKYDSSGTNLWNKQLGVASKDTFGQTVATDSFGNIYVSGYTTGGLDGNALKGTQDFYVTKYTSSGALQWTKQLGVAAKVTTGSGIAIDSNGRLYVTGTTNGGLDGNTLSGATDFFVSQFIGN